MTVPPSSSTSPTTNTSPGRTAPSCRRILVVDDTRAIHEDFRKILSVPAVPTELDALKAELFGVQTPRRSPGFELDSAFQGREALAKVRAAVEQDQPYAMAFVDMRMPPGWDGVETIDRIWACDPRIQMVICTAYSDHSWHDVLQRLDTRDRLLILKKPFEEIEVLQLAAALTTKWDHARWVDGQMTELAHLADQRTAELRSANLVLRGQVEERARLEAELHLASTALDNTPDGMLIIDAAARIVSLNPAFEAITGYSAADLVGRSAGVLRRALPPGDVYLVLRRALAELGHWDGEMWCRRPDGEELLLRMDLSAVGSLDSGHVVVAVGDVTELRRKDEQIHNLAFRDQLTRLPNRALVIDRITDRIVAAERRPGPLGVMFVDLDRFAQINDSYGHEAGDAVLKEVALRLKDCLRAADTVARVEGDAFVVVLTWAEGPEDYAAVAQRVIAELSRPVVFGDHLLRVGASVGIACHPEDGESAADLLTHAAGALRSAKSSGSGRYAFFQPRMTTRAQAHLQLEMDLREAILNGGLHLCYQPKVSLADGGLTGVEALVRWTHPRLGPLAPMEFIPLAEETGLIRELGRWVLDEACRQSARWHGSLGRSPRIAVNVSAAELQQDDLAKDVGRACDRHGIEPSDLEIEITESMVMNAMDSAMITLSQLRQAGATVAIDDFGTGYSSFAYLKDLPVDTLKIDRSFVRDLEEAPRNVEIVRAIIGLADALALTVVAEGVETAGQAALLRGLGCTTAQGFLYARPLPAAELEAGHLGVPAGG